jgi:hypothetical protein
VRLRRKHPEPPSGTITRERAGSAAGIADKGPLGRAHLGASLTEIRMVVVVNRTAGTGERPPELHRRRRAIVIRVATRAASEADRAANADQRHRADSAVRGSAVAAASPSVATPRRPSIGHECQVERRWKNQAHNGSIGQHGERRGKRSDATASPPHRRHHGASGQPSGWRTAAIWRRMAAIIHQPPSTARRRWQNEDNDESPAKGRLQPHSARPAS